MSNVYCSPLLDMPINLIQSVNPESGSISRPVITTEKKSCDNIIEKGTNTGHKHFFF